MSVFQRGGNYLHRHLTKLYSDTKQSYETATVASKTTADEDPTLKALHREFRLQKDRLLAWGLQWSDSNAAPSPDVEIDQKLDQAGLGPAVASVMSNIQKLLIESELLQNSHSNYQQKMSIGRMDSKVLPGKNDLSSDDIAKSQSLLSQLVTCIDSLYTLSESRQTLSTSSRKEKASKESLAKDHPHSMRPPCLQAQNLPSVVNVDGNANDVEKSVREDELFIDPSCITLTYGSKLESEKPPPYEEVMPLEKTRLSGLLEVSKLSHAQRLVLKLQDLSPRDVVVEYLPTMSIGSHSPRDQYRTALKHARQIFERQSSPDLSHTGLLRLLGYTIDISNARHGFVYELPYEQSHQLEPPCSNLRALIPSKRDDSDTPSPYLEDRFRLAFNILLSMLHLSIQGLRHEDLNSTNILILLQHHAAPDSFANPALSPYDIRRPYLLHSPPSAETTSLIAGPLAAIYRHANDTDIHHNGRSWAFDIYSFGLILLEIGLWTPISRLWKPKYSKSTFTSRIKSIYVPKLASRCGTAYMTVVQTCINTPDVFEGPSSNMRSERFERRWTSYMIEIGRGIARCCAIDVKGPSCEPDLACVERLTDERSAFNSPGGLREIGPAADSSDALPKSTAHVESESVTSAGVESNVLAQAQQTILKKWNNVDIPQECLDQWNNYLMPRVSKLLQKALDSSRESCSASLMMVGKTPETAKTTICIQCTSVEKVRDCLRRNFKCKSGWGLVVLRGDVRRSGKTRRNRKRQEGARSRSQPPQPEKSAYQQRPQFGASIGAFRANEHLPPVSFGGAILVDGKPYGMTVHHMLDAPSDDEDEVPDHDSEVVQRSAAGGSDAWLPDLDGQHSGPECDEFQDRFGVLDISDDESECSTIRPDYVDLESGNGGFWFTGEVEGTPSLEDDLGSDSDSAGSSDLEEDGDEDDRVSVGDTAGIDPADDEEVYVTQPAIDDVDDDFFPCVEDRDDDHLASHSLGYVHASSGIRRVVTGNVKHEIDWALIKIRDERLTLGNTIHRHLTQSKRSRKAKEKSVAAPSLPSSTKPPSSTHLTTIASSSSLPYLPVQCHGRTSGLQSGRISPALALVKLHGRTSFSSSWVVEGGGFGIPGDSGAWIYDPSNGRLCGHVLAWGKQSKTAYMAPMEVLFEDIRRRLGAERVELPSGTEGLAENASKQLHRSQVDLLQEDMRNLSLPSASRELELGPGPGDRDDDDDTHMAEGGGPLPASCGPRPTDNTKPMRGQSSEVAISTLQINDAPVQQMVPPPNYQAHPRSRPHSPIRSGKILTKDLPATPASLSPWALGAIDSLHRYPEKSVMTSR